MNHLYDQIALALLEQLVQAGPPEDHECGLIVAGVQNSIHALADLFTARDQIRTVLGGTPEFDPPRFLRLAQEGGEL